MQFLDWKDSYNIGVKEIDNQHRGLFDLISKLFDTKRVYRNDKYFLATFEMFTKFATIHFATEERYMREAKYSKLTEHRQEHEEFILKLSMLATAIKKEEPDIHQKTLDFLKDWYSAHILGTDKDLQEIFREKGFD